MEEEPVAGEGPGHGMALARGCGETAPRRQKMTLIRHPDPLRPGKFRPDSFFCEGQFLENDQVRGALGESLPSRGGGSQQSYLDLEEMCLALEAPPLPHHLVETCHHPGVFP
ncbi:hypothetical protein NDU88_009216 [Pleurodeles waltl]|uniref:Uncharacterized protein n=1 Tax=Pleurodeles waltl TaxID=8319 RepID=A0AAV7P7B9_PLEWA|nr:hypothetical protein NDU88_009213 [Pleurodeles waltl]KAJ1121088.1 hypothetical protein NDU88_009216 [Pleurodeles waltl]